MDEADVVIAGGGPVGAALAAALAGTGLDVRLAEPAPRADPRLRPIALSHGSRTLLERIEAWSALQATPIERIHVSQAGGFGRTVLHAAELGVPALGHVCNLPTLAAALAARVAALGCAPRIDGRLASWALRGERVAAVFDCATGEHALAARLLVLADGARGAGADLDTAARDYGQTAIVAVVSAERAAPHTAWERFTGEGPLALLPFAVDGEPRLALVWTMRSARAADLAVAADADFLDALAGCFGARVGRFHTVTGRESYALALRYRRSPEVAPRVIAIGNAAQTLHPVAGQGLNLGLRDAFELAAALRSAAAGGIDALGGEAMLTAFARARRADRMASISITDALVRVFGSALPGAAWARGIGLAALDLAPAARRVFARRMMLGLRGMP
jgi:2-octaprenyl-6-methoxyphenol hydroxylase